MAQAELALVISARNQAQSTINGLQKTLSGVDKTVQSASERLKGMGQTLRTVGTGMAIGVTAPIVGFGASVLKTAADFEQAMANVNAIANGTESDLQSLTAAAQELGRTTSFSASQAAEGMSFLAMAGFETNEIIAAMPGLLDAAAAGATDLATTADIVSNVLSGFNIDASETGRVSDILTKTFTSSNTSLIQLGEAMKYAAPVAAAMGVSIEEVSTAIAFMSDAGIQASMAGTSVRTTLLSLAAPTEQAAKAMADLGISVLDSQGELLAFPEIIRALESGLSGLTDAQKAATLEMIVGKPAVAGLLAVMARGPEEFASFSDGLRNSVGTAGEVAAKQLNTLQGQLKLLASAWEGLQIAIGVPLLPVLTQSVQEITPAVSRAAEAFANLSPTARNAAIAIAAIVAAIGPLLIVIGSIASGIGALLPVISALGAAFVALASPIGLVIAGLAAIVAFDVGGIRTATVEVLQGIAENLGLASLSIDEIQTKVSAGWLTIKDTITVAVENFSWEDFVETLTWENVVATSLVWSDYITSLDWSAALGTTLDWSSYIGQLTWDNAIVPAIQWGEYIAPIVWSNVVTTSVEWGEYITSLDWTTIITTVIDWATWIPALSWNNFVMMIDLATYVAAFAWSEYISKFSWSEFITTLTDWSSYIGSLDWGTYITSAIDWSVYIAEFTWDSFVSKLEWPVIGEIVWNDYISQLRWPVIEWSGWADFVPNLVWPSVAWAGWAQFVPTLRWPSITWPGWKSFIPKFAWPEIPRFPGWAAFNPFGGGGGQSTDNGSIAPSGSANNAIGTRNWRGGVTWVGETGPELVSLPRGSRIFSNNDSMQLAGGGGVNVTVNVASIANDIDIDAMAYRVAEAIRRRR